MNKAKRILFLSPTKVLKIKTITFPSLYLLQDSKLNNIARQPTTLVGDKLVYLSADNDINLLSSTRTQIRGNNAVKGPTANQPLDKTDSELQHGKGNVEQGGGNYKETKDKILDNQAANQKANESSKFGEHVAKEQEINANSGKRPEDKIWTETSKKESVTNAYDHWDKHKHEFPEFQNSKQYVDATHNFVRNPPEGTLKKVRENGDTLYYNPSKNIFAIKNADGTPRTMFKPEKGLEYWNKQK